MQDCGQAVSGHLNEALQQGFRCDLPFCARGAEGGVANFERPSAAACPPDRPGRAGTFGAQTQWFGKVMGVEQLALAQRALLDVTGAEARRVTARA